MKERAERQRTNFIARAKLDESQATRFDVLVSSMNVRLGERLQEWNTYLSNNVLPRAEARARVMKDISAVMVLTYDEMDRNMPPGWRDEAGPEFSLPAFIDPEIARGMRPIVGRGFGGGGRGFGGPGPGPNQNPR